MARMMEVREVCERALRKIGAYSIRDTGADAAELAEARYWLDMVVGHVSTGRRRSWWLVEQTVPLTLVAATTAYDLTDLLDLDAPIAHVITVTAVETVSGRRTPVDIARRWMWEERDVDESGPPAMVYIDRGREPTLNVWPTPVAPVAHRLDMVIQRESPDLTAGAVTEKLTKFRDAWNLYLVTALAAQIGNGPVRKLPQDEVRDMKVEAERLLFDLEAFDAQEQANEPRRVTFHDF